MRNTYYSPSFTGKDNPLEDRLRIEYSTPNNLFSFHFPTRDNVKSYRRQANTDIKVYCNDVFLLKMPLSDWEQFDQEGRSYDNLLAYLHKRGHADVFDDVQVVKQEGNKWKLKLLDGQGRKLKDEEVHNFNFGKILTGLGRTYLSIPCDKHGVPNKNAITIVNPKQSGYDLWDIANPKLWAIHV